ncbi:MAG: efflux RND transporter permease subunit [Holosporales bacterium]|jgi:multidrug efflux pump|nr:efflux RND transporter permease subunit [Holosporales bacterium]
MKLSEICIERPVFAWVMTLVVVLLGLVTGERLPIRQYPNVSKNYITVKMDYHGVGPEIIETQITRNIEEAVAGVEGIDSIESTSDNGTSKVHIAITEKRDIDSATNDIRDRLSKWADRFPDDAQEPILTKAGSDEKAVINIVLISSKMSNSWMYNFASNEISHVLESVPGVARVDVFGSGKYKMSLSLDPRRMAFYGLTVIDVANAIRRQNIERPAGKIINKDREYVISTVASVETPEEFEDIPIVVKNNSVIKLRDIGNAKLDTSDKKVMSRFNGEKVVSVAIIAQSSSNPIQIARGVKIKFEEMKRQAPEDVKLCIAYDSTTFIEKSLYEVYKTMVESILLVVLVVFVFLKSMRAALVPLITVPISLVGALFIMYIAGFSINNMTLMSMVLAIGLVVDDAIVILENIYKYIEKGLPPIKAAIEGTKEVSFAVIAMTLTLCAVYAPVALAEGTTGKWLKEFSVTLAGAVFLSGFIALTLSPMMCSRTLISTESKNNKKTKLSFFQYSNLLDKIKDKLDASELLAKIDLKYSTFLQKILNKKRTAVIAAVIFSVFGYAIFFFMPAEQIPYQDMGIISFEGHAPQTSTLEYTQRYVDALDKMIGGISEVESREYRITNPSFEGDAVLKDDRERSTDDVMANIKEKYDSIAGIDVRFSSGHGGGDESSRNIMFVVRGNKSHRELRELSSNLVHEMYEANIVQGIRSSSNSEAEEHIVEILKDKASAINIDPDTIATTIDSLIRGRVASHFKKENKMYDVMVEIADDFKKTKEQLGEIYIKHHTEGQKEESMLPLIEVINVYSKSGPVSIQRYNRTRSHTVFGILNASTSLAEAIEVVRDIAKKTLPEDVFVDFIGDTKKYLNESHTMMLIFFLAISFIYLVMAAQFESWRDPFIIMLSVPLALVGGVIALTCVKSGTVNIFSNIGFLTLIGLITKHGILIVDSANKLVKQGKSYIDSIQEAAKRRLRPIMMTTFAMVLGALPLAFATGAGSEIRIPLGVVIVGGMAIGTFFTIFLVPVFYLYIAQLKKM